jgi:hypothetical protein
MKPSEDKPNVINFANRHESQNRARFAPSAFLDAIKPLDRCDYIHFSEGQQVNVGTLRDVLNTWDKSTAGSFTATPEGLIMCDGGLPVSQQTLYWRKIDRIELTDDGAQYCCPHNENKTVFLAQLDLDAEISHDPKVNPWLLKAVSKYKERPLLQKVYGNALACDGWRLHHDLSQPDPTDFPKDWRAVYPPKGNTATIKDAKILAAAVKTAKAINKDVILLSVNGKMDISALDATDWGEKRLTPVSQSTITEGYTHSGQDVKLAIDPRFVLDALSGMKGKIALTLGGPNAPLQISDGHYEAVIMPKNIG